jgi:hypothetical protein
MDQWTQDKLHINPRSDETLRGVLAGFEQKWQYKARHHLGSDTFLL